MMSDERPPQGSPCRPRRSDSASAGQPCTTASFEALSTRSACEWHDLISEELFRDALVRERKRADRFEEAFVLVLITLDSRRRHRNRAGRELVEALSQSRSTPT